jgi:hypothetical protein
LVLVLGLLALAIPKSVFNPYPVGPFSDDGSLYYQVARHVQEGDGLKSSVSLYNAGFRDLPSATNVYPLWPLLLGYSARGVGLNRAASILPEFFYFCSLGLLYWLTLLGFRSIGGDPALIRWKGVSILDAGHLVVAIFGLNPILFRYSSFPYTEPMAFTLAFAALITGSYAIPGRRPGLTLAAGALAGLAYLTRSQMLGLMLALPIAALLTSRAGLRQAATLLLGSALAVVPWLLYLVHSFPTLSLQSLLDPTFLRVPSHLTPFDLLVRSPTLWAHLADRLHGVRLAFDPVKKVTSYLGSFGDVAYLVPLALVCATARTAAAHSWKPDGPGRGKLLPLVTTTTFPLWAISLTGLLLLLPVHELHANRWGGWFFGFRPGLPLIILIVASATVLLTSPWWWRIPAIALLLMGVYQAALGTRHVLWSRDLYSSPNGAQRELASWIEAQSRLPVIATAGANAFGAITRGLYHDVECGDPRRQMLVYLDELHVEYVLAAERQKECRFVTSISDRLRPAQVFGSGPERLTLWSTTP